MKELKRIEDKVKLILEESEICRNSDNHLFLEYIQRECPELLEYPAVDFQLHYRDFGIPTFDSISRARRKLQAEYEELRGCEDVRRWRAENETQFRRYANEGKIRRNSSKAEEL